ncbi:MAG: formate dehydrogenase accessory protein FdhE [Candidatus Firestonebacteria bacterium]
MIKVDEAVKYYKGIKPQLGELLDLYVRINSLQSQYIEQMSYTLSISSDLAIEKLKSGKYLLEKIPFIIDKENFMKLVNDLIKLMKDSGEKAGKVESLFLSSPEYIPTELQELTDCFIKSKELTLHDKNLVHYILWQALKTFYKKEAKNLKSINDKSYWTKSICPVCGNLPKISRLMKETGKRQLVCSLCWTEWSFTRISCPYCLNTCQDKLGYFYIDDDKAYRIDVCHICKNYIKTIDEKQIGRETVLEIEDIITYHMDILAFSKGYKNPLNLSIEK